KLPHCIHRHQAVRSPQRAERGQGSTGGLPKRKIASYAEVGADPIHGGIVGVGALSVHPELSLVGQTRGGHHNTEPGFSSKLISSASWTCRITSGLINLVKPDFSTSMR